MVKKAAKSTDNSKTPDFEKALAELEALVDKMEQGDISLEDSLACFERGMALTRQCQEALKNAEQKVRILLKDSKTPVPFEDADGD